MVCPVKIDIHNQLFLWRQQLKKYKNFIPESIYIYMNYFFQSSSRMMNLNKIIHIFYKFIPKFVIKKIEKKYNRKLPEIPKKSFRILYKENYYDKFK